MMEKQYGKIENTSENFNKEYAGTYMLRDTIKAGNALILALEDLIELLRNSNISRGSYGKTYRYENVATHSSVNTKEKAFIIKDLFTDFQKSLSGETEYSLKGLEKEIASIKKSGEYYMDELLSGWFIQSEIDKAIDNTHDICSKIRDLMRKIKCQ